MIQFAGRWSAAFDADAVDLRSLELTGFIAVVGISAEPDFVRGLQASGVR
jgi:hypothetical protein